MTETYDITLERIKEAHNRYNEIHNNIRINEQFNITWQFGSGHPVTKVYTVEKLYPFYVLLSHMASGVKVYDGYAYEDVYMMKQTGKSIDSMSVAESLDFFGEEEAVDG